MSNALSLSRCPLVTGCRRCITLISHIFRRSLIFLVFFDHLGYLKTLSACLSVCLTMFKVVSLALCPLVTGCRGCITLLSHISRLSLIFPVSFDHLYLLKIATSVGLSVCLKIVSLQSDMLLLLSLCSLVTGCRRCIMFISHISRLSLIFLVFFDHLYLLKIA